jgi:hypothetical protein
MAPLRQLRVGLGPPGHLPAISFLQLRISFTSESQYAIEITSDYLMPVLCPGENTPKTVCLAAGRLAILNGAYFRIEV